MKGSDIVIGWIKEDSTPFLDVSLTFKIYSKRIRIYQKKTVVIQMYDNFQNLFLNNEHFGYLKHY